MHPTAARFVVGRARELQSHSPDGRERLAQRQRSRQIRARASGERLRRDFFPSRPKTHWPSCASLGRTFLPSSTTRSFLPLALPLIAKCFSSACRMRRLFSSLASRLCGVRMEKQVFPKSCKQTGREQPHPSFLFDVLSLPLCVFWASILRRG